MPLAKRVRELASAALVMGFLITGQLTGPVRAGAAGSQEVWLHYDYMVASDSRSFAPDPAALQLVVDVYAAHGIALHIDAQHAVIPESFFVRFSSLDRFSCPFALNQVIPDFTTLKATYFHPTANHDWHYVLFANNSDCTGMTGEAELPGNNFEVALGALQDGCQCNTPIFVAGAFMHELGHNLGLYHGGFEDTNFKPNYISVMNYLYNFGIPYAATLGATTFAGLRLDYSDSALPTLDENHLNENVGVQAGTTDLIFFSGPSGEFGVGAGSGPIDWNLDGNTTDTNLLQNIELDPGVPIQQLKGFDDWAAVHTYLSQTTHHGPKRFERENRQDQPMLTGISPASGLGAGGTTVTISGRHLKSVTQVKFGDQPATSFSIMHNGIITAVSPPGTGTVQITLFDSGDPSRPVPAGVFTYLAPIVTSITPSSAHRGTQVTIKGSNFTGATQVEFGFSRNALYFQVVDDHTILAGAPDQNNQSVPCADTVDVKVHSGPSVSAVTPADHFTYLGAPRTSVTSVVPKSGPVSGGNRFMVHGTGFSAGVYGFFFTQAFKSVPAQGIKYLSDTAISVTAPPAPFGPGPAYLELQTSCGGIDDQVGSPSYTYFANPTSPPAVSSLTPGTGLPGGGTQVTIHGAGFLSVTSMSFGGAAASDFTIVDDGTITAISPPGTGMVDVKASNIAGSSTASVTDEFTYVDAMPAVTSVSPSSGPSGGGLAPTVVTIHGSGFSSVTAVHFGSASPPFSVVDGATINVFNPSSALGPGTVDVTVTNQVGTSATSLADRYTFT